tara:strand:- start:105 stop:299 length:195 start_codon:yes stop_codon:yes gene_type:complete
MTTYDKIERTGVLFAFAVSAVMLTYFIMETIYFAGYAVTGGLVLGCFSFAWFLYHAVRMMTGRQ